MTNLVSTAPGVWTAFVDLVTAAAENVTIGGEPVSVFPFELEQYEPSNYVWFTGMEQQAWTPEAMNYQFLEHYDICGVATVFTGAALSDDPSVATTVLNNTYELFNTVVMSTFVENRDMPILGATPTPFQGLPVYTRYRGQPGNFGGAQAGWSGVIEWAYHFDAYIVPV